MRILMLAIILWTPLFSLAESVPESQASNWRESFEFLSPQPYSKFHNIETRLAFRTGQLLDISGLIVNPELVSIEGQESGVHDYSIILSRDGRTVNIIPKVPFSPNERVEVEISGGIFQELTQDEVFFSWSFFTSGKLSQNASTHTVETLTSNRNYIQPEITIGPLPGLAPGNIFVNLSSNSGYLAVHNFQGNSSPIWSQQSGLKGNDFKINKNGLPSYCDRSDMSWRIMDSNGIEIDSLYMVNGYNPDYHDFQILPNWTSFMFGYDDQEVDMSAVVPGGDPNAMVEGFVIQEIDADGVLILQWRSWDYFEITDNQILNLTGSDLNLFHVNSLEIDADSNVIISCRHTEECTKYNRTTGEIIWRWGGSANQFQYALEDAFSYQHDIRRLANGNILVFDNANMTNQNSRSIEYQVNEETYEVQSVWQYEHYDGIFAASMGGNVRLPNGNTIIYWGNVASDGVGGRITEVNQNGVVLLEMIYPDGSNSYRTPKHEWMFGEVTEGCGDPEAFNFDPEVVASNIFLCVYDEDGDGVPAPEDCNDSDNSIFPGAQEIANDGIDQDCDGSDWVVDDSDTDGDGFSLLDGDCNDADASIYPGAEEIPYDGIDQDCDGMDLTDVDGDGFSPDGGDCEDGDASIFPGAEEIPNDGIDQDCDGFDYIVGVNDNSQWDVSVYFDGIDVVFSGDISENSILNIFSATGQCLFRDVNFTGESMNVESLSDGVYYFVITSPAFYHSYPLYLGRK